MQTALMADDRLTGIYIRNKMLIQGSESNSKGSQSEPLIEFDIGMH